MLSILKVKKTILNNKYLFFVWMGALVIRFLGIDHGYPYIFNVDEPALVRSTLGLNFTPIIDHFDWPHFNYYFNYLFYFVFIKARGVVQVLNMRSFLENPFPILWNDPYVFYFISRIISAVLGSLTVVPVYLLARSIFPSKVTSLISAVFLGLIPFHVFLSHYALQDVNLLFWVSWAVWFMYKSVKSNEVRYYALSGLFLGFAAGTKYNGLMFGLLLPLFYLESLIHFKFDFKKSQFSRFIKYSLIASVVSVGVFLLTSPSIIAEWDVFWSNKNGRGFLWQLHENLAVLPFSMYLPKLKSVIFALKTDLSPALFYLILLGIVNAIFWRCTVKSRKNVNWLRPLAVMLIFYVLYTSRYSRSISHYFVPIYGISAVLSAGIFELKIIGKLKYLILLIVIVFMLTRVFDIDRKFVNVDTRTRALAYYSKVDRDKNKVYYRGEVFKLGLIINNLEMYKYEGPEAMNPGDIAILDSQAENRTDLLLLEAIHDRNALGQNLYVYKKLNVENVIFWFPDE